MTVLLAVIVIVSLLSLAAVIILLLRGSRQDFSLTSKFEQVERNQDRMERGMKEEIARNRAELNTCVRQTREETTAVLKSFQDSLLSRMKENENSQKNQLDTFAQQLASLSQLNEQKLESLREVVQARLKALQDENSSKLEQMRLIVDEKLHTVLERRLNDSFKKVSDHLESVHRGLGEMQALASNVGDLKKVLVNVKTRGTWGEIQLGMLLEQMLTPEQYAANVETKKNSNERVEFAIKLPGRDDEHLQPVWLPIDAKFPQEDYLRLLQAQEEGNTAEIEKMGKQLEVRIKMEARNIKEKYLAPPYTTDFSIMYLPTEGLFAEVLRRPGLFDKLQRDYRVAITGPTTLAAVLNSLQMGFRTLAIQKRSSQVWRLLAVVKQEFIRFGDVLDKTQKKLSEASSNIELATKRSRKMEKRLDKVQELPSVDDAPLLPEMADTAAGADVQEEEPCINEGNS